MDLADPPIWQQYVLESPWPLVVALLIVAAALSVAGLRDKRKRLTAAGLIVALLAGAVLALATAVATKREQLLASTADLLAYTDPVNSRGLQSIFTRDITLQNNAGQVWMQRADILARLDRLQSETPIGKHKVTDIKAEARGDRGYVDVRLSTSGVGGSPFGNLPILSRWLLVWELQPDGTWLLDEIRWVEFQLNEPQPNVLQ